MAAVPPDLDQTVNEFGAPAIAPAPSPAPAPAPENPEPKPTPAQPAPAPKPQAVQPDLEANALRSNTDYPDTSNQESPTPSQESLIRSADNPLQIRESANKAIIDQTLAQSRANAPVAPAPPQEPVTVPLSTKPSGPPPPDAEMPQMTLGAQPPPDQESPIGPPPDADTQPPDTPAVKTPDYGDHLGVLSAKYNNDPDAIARGFYNHEIEDPQEALNAILHARDAQDAKYSGMGEFQANWQKTVDDARNALNWCGRFIEGAKSTTGSLTQIPGQVLNTVQNAAGIIAPSTEGSKQLQQLPGPQPISAVAQGPLGTGVDIVTGGQGGNLATTPQGQGQLEQELSAQSQAHARAAAVGAEEGLGQLSDWTINAFQNLVGLSAMAPNAALKLFGGPQIGHIDPKVQLYLMAHGVPIVSTQSYNEMDPRNIAANLITGRYMDGMHAQEDAGYGTPTTEGMLKAFYGQTVMTPEELQAHGHPVPTQALKDTAAVVNLAAGYAELGAVGKILQATGMTSLASHFTDTVLEKAAEGAQNLAENAASAKAPPLVRRATAELISRAPRALVAHAVGSALGFHSPWIPIVAGLLKTPVSQDAAEAVLKNTLGIVPKVVSIAARETGDALHLAANDPDNLLATRGTAKQLLTLGIRRTAQGLESVAPTLLGATTPEQMGGQVALGGGLSLLHTPVDLYNTTFNRTINSAFITDFNRYRPDTPEDPVRYGTNKNLDDQHEQAINSLDPATGKPLVSNAIKNLINDTRTQADGMAEMYVLNPKAYQTELARMRDLGWVNHPDMNSRGVAIDPNPELGQARILIRSDAIQDALMHELAHPIVNRLALEHPEHLQSLFEAYSRTNDPNEFTMGYTQALGGPGSVGTDFDSLPTEAEAQDPSRHVKGFEGMTKEDMMKEMAAEAVSGLLKGGSIKSLTRDPAMLHRTQQAFWQILNNLGFDPELARTISPLGLKQSMSAAMILEPMVRQTLRDNLGQGAGVPPKFLEKAKPGFTKPEAQEAAPPPTTPEGVPGTEWQPSEEDIKAMMGAKGGFTREQAIDILKKAHGPAVPGAEQAPKQNPRDIAFDTLTRFQNFTPEEVNRHLPGDVTNATEAIQKAREAILKEREASGPKVTPPETPEEAKNVNIGGVNMELQPEGEKGPAEPPKGEGELTFHKEHPEAEAEKPEAKPAPPEPVSLRPLPHAGLLLSQTGLNPKQAKTFLDQLWALGRAPQAPQKASIPHRPPGEEWQPSAPIAPGTAQTTAPNAPVPGTPGEAQPAPMSNVSAPPTNAPAEASTIEEQAIRAGAQVPGTEQPTIENGEGRTTEESAPTQKYLREQEGKSPGQAQAIVHGKLSPADAVTQANRHLTDQEVKDADEWLKWNWSEKGAPPKRVTDAYNKRAAIARSLEGYPETNPRAVTAGAEPRPPLAHQSRGNIGYFGYAGDSGWDTKSLRGIGAFGHTSNPGSLIPDYSAALTDAGARLRHVVPGQEFVAEDGRTYRYDDKAPDHAFGHKVPDDYVDVYQPSHGADPGMSPARIAENERIMAGVGIGSAGKRGPLVEGVRGPISPGASIVEQSITPPKAETTVSPKAEAPTPPPDLEAKPEAPKETKESVPERPPEITQDDISGIINNALSGESKASFMPGPRAPHELPEAQRDDLLKAIGERHAAALAPDDTRVRYHPETGMITGTHFVDSDNFHRWLLSTLNPDTWGHEMMILRAVQDAIRDKQDLAINYRSAPHPGEGAPTALERAEAQLVSSAEARAKGEAEHQLAGKDIMPNYVGVALGKGKEYGSIVYGGVSPSKVAENADRIHQVMGGQSPYAGGPLGAASAEEDFRGYLDNVRNGWRGSGSAPMKPLAGEEGNIPIPAPDFTPYHLGKAKANFWNLAINGKGAKLSQDENAARSQAAFALARLNHIEPKDGYTNALAREIAMSHGDEWINNKLHSGYEMLRAHNTEEINPGRREAAEPIHPGYEVANKALREKGVPPSQLLKAGFMPGERPGEVQYHGEHWNKEIAQERLLAPAFRVGNRVFSGNTLDEARTKIGRLGKGETPEEGFVTDQGRFVNTNQAAEELRSGTVANRAPVVGTREAMAQAQQERVAHVRATKAAFGWMPDISRRERIAAGKEELVHTTPESFIAARDKGEKYQRFLSPLKPDDLSQHELLANKDHTIGLAVDPQGDIQNVFNNGGPKGAVSHVLIHAINNGALTLDCYDGFLPKYYHQLGFQETGRMKFNPEYAHGFGPEDGSPDVVFMAWKGYPEGGAEEAAYRAATRKEWIENEPSTKYETDWDAAKAASREAAIKPGGAGDNRGPREGREEAVSGAGPTGAEAGAGNRRTLAPDELAKKLAHIEQQQRSLDLSTPEGDRRWDQLQGRVHELRAQSKAQFMPGDLVENDRGEVERIKAAAIRYNGVVYEGYHHGEALENAWADNPTGIPRGSFDEGFTTNSGRFVDRNDAWKIARSNKQLKPFAAKLENQPGGQFTTLGGKAEGLGSEALKRTQAQFMPGDTVEGPEGERERIRLPDGAAIRSPEGHIYTGTWHGDAQDNAEKELGRPLTDDELMSWTQGYVTDKDRFITGKPSWRLAKKAGQLAPGAEPLDTGDISDTGRPDASDIKGLGKELHNINRSQFMPGQTETNNIGATVRNADEKTEPLPGEWLRYGPKASASKVSWMPMAGTEARGFQKAQEEGGTFTGPTGQPRFEIDDSKAVYTKPPLKTPVLLSDYLHHPELYENYPDLKNMLLIRKHTPSGVKASYYPEHDTIVMSPSANVSDLIHEVQHAVQDLQGEKFGAGTIPDQRQLMHQKFEHLTLAPRISDLYNQFVPKLSRAEFEAQHSDLAPEQLDNAWAQYIDRWYRQRDQSLKTALNQMVPYGRYWREPTEVEAREAQKRLNMTPEERAASPPTFEPGEPVTHYSGVPENYQQFYNASAHYLPALQAPPEVRAQYAETPERNAFVADVQEKARKALAKPHPLSGAAAKLPDRKDMKIEELAEHFDKQKEPADVEDPKVQKQMAAAATHDVLAHLAVNGKGVSWYDVIPDGALRYMNDHVDNTILASPENTFHYKVAQAISSQDQNVFNNTETGYEAYKYWREHGKFPTTKEDMVGGGTKIGSIMDNFKLVNDLSDKMGWKGLADLFDKKMSVKKMRELGLDVASESPKHEMQASLALGPKIGAFYAALNKHFENLVMDKWFTRSMRRMSGGMLTFKESAFRKQAATVRDQIQNGQVDIPQERADAITGQIDNLLSKDTLTRNDIIRDAPDLVQWAHDQHKIYADSDASATGGTKSYGDKTPVNKNAKQLDIGLHGLNDAPNTIPERNAYRDIIGQVQQNLKKAGIDMTVADIQAQLWYMEQNLFSKVGAASKVSGNNDYLDAAFALDKYYRGENNPVQKTAKKPKKAQPVAAFMPSSAMPEVHPDLPTFEPPPHIEHGLPLVNQMVERTSPPGAEEKRRKPPHAAELVKP